MITVPADLKSTIDEAWEATGQIPGYLLENEAKFLGFLAALTPPRVARSSKLAAIADGPR